MLAVSLSALSALNSWPPGVLLKQRHRWVVTRAARISRPFWPVFGTREDCEGGLPGDCASALADLDQASALDPKNAYSALWLDIITTRNNLPNCLSQLVSQVDMTKWPAPLVRLFMGELTPTAALPAADDADLNQKKGPVCEANFAMTLDRLTTAAIEGIADQM